LLVVAAMMAAGQQTRKEVTVTTTPAQDAKPNSAAVPDVYAITGQLEKVVILRFKYQTDLLDGLQKMVKEQKIRNAVILAGAYTRM
jgi:hypothetical protein